MAAIHDVARQLSEQMEANNDLLVQMGQLETQQLAFQRAVQEKQAQLRQALQVADAARAESNEMRRKLAVAQDVANKLSEEAKAAKVENGTLKRHVEMLDKSLNDAKNEIAVLKDGKASLSSEVEALARDNRVLARDLEEAASEAEERIAALMQQNAALTRDLSEQRARQAPMHAELDTLRAAVVKAQDEAEGLKRARADAASRAERSLAALSEREAALRDSQAAEGRLGRMLEDERARAQAAEAKVASLQDSLASKDVEVSAAVSRERESLTALQASQDEVAGLRREAEALAAEVLAVSRARAQEGEAYEARLRDSMEDIRRIADEARARESAHAADRARHAEEIIAVRKDAEAAIEAAHADSDALAAALDKERSEASSAARQWEDKRAALERTAAEAMARAAAGDSDKDRAITGLRAALEESKSSCAKLRDELSLRAEGYTVKLGEVQAALRDAVSTVHRLKEDGAAARDRAARMVAKVEDALGPSSVSPLESWYEEARRAFALLGDRVQAERRRADAERDNTRAAEVAAEELRGRVLMLEEGLSRAEHEAVAKAALLKEAQATLAGREEATQKELRAAAAVAAELQGEVARLRDKVDKGNKARIGLQTELSKAQADLADSQARAASRAASLEEQVSSLQGSVRVLTGQLDELGDTAAKLQVQVETTAAALDIARKEKAVVQAEADRAAEAAKTSLASYASQVSALSDGLRAMEKQLKSTQALLAVVKEQKTALSEANAQLRAELDGIYSSSLAGAMQPQGETPV